MRKRLPLLLLFAALLALLLYALASWGLAEIAARPLTGSLVLTDPTLAGGLHSFTTGNFTITLSAIGQDTPGGYRGPRLYAAHTSAPGRWLWYTQRGQAFAAAARGQETIRENRGSYTITDQLSRACTDQTIDSITQTESTVRIAGKLACAGQKKIGYTLNFHAASENQLAFDLSFDDPAYNRTYFNGASDADEHFFGFGEQYSYFDLKGQRVPIWVSEQGIGRGQQPVTFLVNLAAGAGGNDLTTYAAVPHYITSRLRSLALENHEYSVFDLRDPNRVQISVFSPKLTGRLFYGPNPEALVSEYTAFAGRMRALPDWILDGAVVGMQGGTEKVRQVYAKLKALGTPVSAFWLQDWVGQRTTSFGKQLWWNWELDANRYPGWDALRADLAKDNVRVMLYASPFLADISAVKPGGVHRNLFQEAKDAGYLVQRAGGGPYLVQNSDFSAGLVDLTNPQARAWYKAVLKDQLVGAGASGWMADYGEALPADARLFNGASGKDEHNAYPEQWAQLNRETIDALPNSGDYVFFTRSAFTQSPRYTTLMFEGDQLTTWDAHDGIKTAITGLVTGGLSGFSLNHSDIGGYTGINNPLLHIRRSKELLLRWMELSAFTPIYRTHEGNTPDQNAQFYSDDQTLRQFDRFAKVYQAWGFLRKRLVKNAADTGVPVVRPLFMNYPDDPVTYRLSYQEFLVGPDVLVAPVVDPGKTTGSVYLPAGSWVHVWSGVPYRSPFQGQWVTVNAPIGQPPVFVKEGVPDGQTFLQNLKQAGLVK